jgi:hypothetical protein
MFINIGFVYSAMETQLILNRQNPDPEQIKWIQIKRSIDNKVLTTGHYWFIFGARIGLVIKH